MGKRKRIVREQKVDPATLFDFSKKKVEEIIPENIPKKIPGLGGLMILKKECDCGFYQPTSTKGLIINDCKNCGGRPPKIVYGK